MFKNKTFLKILVLAITLSIVLPQFSEYAVSKVEIKKDITPEPQKEWTFMLYLAADTRDHLVTSSIDNNNNSIGEAIENCFWQVSNYDVDVGFEANLNIIALVDHPYDSSHPQGYAEIIQVKVGWEANIILDDLGATNMGSRYTLRDFISFCKTNFPANNYALLLSDHGRGYAGLIYDYHASHPSYEYALGDCLTLEELKGALSDTQGGIDVLFLNTCLGGSFELMWQLYGYANYVVAGETIQVGLVLYHPRDILYALSRDPFMTPLELAQMAFDAGQAPTLVPSYPYNDERWQSIGIYDLSKLPGVPGTQIYNLAEVFEDFSGLLLNEFTFNETRAQLMFRGIRDELSYISSLFSSNSMMVDLMHFAEKVIEHISEFQGNKDMISSYATSLINLITPAADHFLVDYWDRGTVNHENINGFSICFPNTRDKYDQYLYKNFYEDLDISDDTDWEEFIFATYPDPLEPIWDFHIPEFWEINLLPIDPTVDLHVFFGTDPLEEPLHVGPTGKINDYCMDVELGIGGAEYIDDFLTGAATIILPATSIISMDRASTPVNFQVVVNATSAASASKDVNLSIRHVKDSEILWEDTQESSIEVGQDLVTDISTDDEWSDLEQTNKPSGFIGPEKPFVEPVIAFSFSIIVLVIFSRKSKIRK